MTEQTTHFGPRYRTLDDIRLRKAQLLTDITKDSNRIAGLWNELMHKPKDKNSPTQRFSGVLSTGAGVLDGLILSWSSIACLVVSILLVFLIRDLAFSKRKRINR